MAKGNQPNKGRKGKNPGKALAEAEDMVRRFHGREPKGDLHIKEVEQYDKELPVLGQLLELKIMTANGTKYVPIIFARMKGKKPDCPLDEMVQVCSDLKGKNIYFKGGDQELDIQKLAEKGVYQEGYGDSVKELCIVGPVFSISYFTDKHHLEGPKYQAKGAAYEHEFAEEADKEEYGEQPILIYDSRNKRMFLSGGSYEIKDEGIYN